MKKIIAAFDGLKYSGTTAEYAIHIAKQLHCHLVGIFLDDMIYHSFRFSDVIEDDEVSEKKLKALNEKDAATRRHAISVFESACEHAGLEYGGMEIEGDAFTENIAGWRAFDEYPRAAVGERREDGDAVQLRGDGVILRADDPELVFSGAHEGAAIGLQRGSDFRRQLTGDGAYGLCGACDLQQGKAPRLADLQDRACIRFRAGEG